MWFFLCLMWVLGFAAYSNMYVMPGWLKTGNDAWDWLRQLKKPPFEP